MFANILWRLGYNTILTGETESDELSLEHLGMSKRGVMQPSLVPAVSPSCIASYLRESFDQWEGNSEADTQKQSDLLQRRNQERERLKYLVTPTLSQLLERAVDSDQIDWALEKAFRATGSRLLYPHCAKEITLRQRQLRETERTYFLEVRVSTHIRSVSIPDPSKDEITLETRTASGADVDALLSFMVANEMIKPNEVDVTKDRWLKSDASIGRRPEEAEHLERCLAVNHDERVESNVKSIEYNIGLQTRKLWRVCDTLVRVRAQFNLAEYPSDESLICLHMCARGYFDPSERILLPDETAPRSFEITRAEAPRGFKIGWSSDSLEPLARSLSRDNLPESILRFAFLLQRRLDTSFWRTFIPTLLVLLVGSIATFFAAATGLYVESVMTGVIPAVLIACVALQLTAAQLVPYHTGRTRLDEVFVMFYLHLFLLYISLRLMEWGIQWYTLGVSALLFAAAIMRYVMGTKGGRP